MLWPASSDRTRNARGRENQYMTDWAKVEAGEIGEGEMTAVPVGDRMVAIANVGGNLHAFDDVCTHRQCSLAEGDLEGLVIECPCHGSQFDITSGEVVNGPATEPIDVFEVQEEDGQLLVSLE
jgi:3-phenylpropionate/trans-cinnamate dioxygenase ferredoxin subunit